MASSSADSSDIPLEEDQQFPDRQGALENPSVGRVATPRASTSLDAEFQFSGVDSSFAGSARLASLEQQLQQITQRLEHLEGIFSAQQQPASDPPPMCSAQSNCDTPSSAYTMKLPVKLPLFSGTGVEEFLKWIKDFERMMRACQVTTSDDLPEYMCCDFDACETLHAAAECAREQEEPSLLASAARGIQSAAEPSADALSTTVLDRVGPHHIFSVISGSLCQEEPEITLEPLETCQDQTIAGDRSLTFVIAHEISHSWTGNLVTNATWDHFWLNEGHTTFAERKISGKLARSEPHRHFLAFNGWKSLEYAVKEQMSPKDPLTQLVVKLEDVDPDDAFSTVPYEKGHTFLFYLEQKVGGPKVFEEFLRSYLDHFKYKSITTDVWREYLETYFGKRGVTFEDVDWDSWLYKPGLPPMKPDYDQTLVEESTKLCEKWVSSDEKEVGSFKADEFIRMSAHQREEFLSQLLGMDRLPHYKLKKMEELYELNATKNSEIRFAWIRLGLKGQWPEIVALAQEFITSQGRMKFTRPIYKDMFEWEHTKQGAIDTFQKNRAFMHSTTAKEVGKLLGL